MDIRNFFSQKGGGAAGKKKKTTEETAKGKKDKSSESGGAKKITTAKSGATVAPVAKTKEASKLKKRDEKDDDEEIGIVKKKGNQKKKKKIIFDEDSDATTGEDILNSESTNNNIKESDPAGEDSGDKPDTKQQEEKQQKSVVKKKKPDAVKQEISPDDFFASSSKTPANKPKKSYVIDDSDGDDEVKAMDEIALNKTDRDDDDFADLDSSGRDDESETDKLNSKKPSPKRFSSKKLASPPVSKRRNNKTDKSESPAKKQKLKEYDSDDYADLRSDAEDDEEYEEPKPKTPPSAKKKRTAVAKALSPSKKRKTPPSSSKKPKKEPPLEPTLELDNFNIDDAAPECLQGLTFVFTGVLPDLARDDAQEFVKTLGGRVTSAVSSKTTYLVVGELLEDGRYYKEGKKYQMATDLGTIVVVGEKKLYGLAKLYSDRIRASQPAVDKENNRNQASSNESPSAPATVSKASVNNPYANKAAVNNPYAKKTGGAANPYAKASNPYIKTKPSASLKNDEDYEVPLLENTNGLWVDRFAPKTTRDILGNQENVNKLTGWLSRWESRFNNEQAVGKSFSNPNGPWKAALLSGPPGIGKTTTATLVAREQGRDLIEFNASDVRSKKFMQDSLGDITGSQSVEGYFKSSKNKSGRPSGSIVHQKRCIIMDEVDGMGGGDRGGMAELIQMIKNSRVPIICICNDRQSQKMKSLLPYCLDLRFRRPVKSVIASAAIRIAEREGLKVERNAAEAIVESCGNDIRQILNCLQMWNSEADKKDREMTYKGLKDREREINKDAMLRVNLFDASKLILEGRRGLAGADPEVERDSFFRRNDAFFVDYSFTGLIVQQNYLKVMGHQFNEVKRSGDDQRMDDFLNQMHAAAESMSDFNMVENRIRGGTDMNWGLLPFAGALGVKTGFHAAGPSGAFFPGFPEFSTWLGRNSSKGKKQRILGELNHHMNYKISGGTQEVRLSYLPFLRQNFMTKLKDSSDENSNKEIIQLMDDYGLDRDDVFENLDEFKMDPKGKNFADIDSKRKAAFTREYNQGSHKSQALVDEQGASKKSKKKGGSNLVGSEDPDAINDDDNQNVDDEDENEDEEDIEKLRAAFKKKGRKPSAGKTKSGGGTAAAAKRKSRKKK